MSEGIKHGSMSNLPIRKPRKLPVMGPAHRSQSGCSTDAENKNPFPRGPTGLARTRLGNRMKKPVLSECRQNQLGSNKPLLHPFQRVTQNDISKSTPDLSRPGKSIRPKIAGKNLQKINSMESLSKGKAMLPPPRASTFGKQENEGKKTKRGDVGVKKTIGETKRVQKQVENKRKCTETQKLPVKEVSSTGFRYSVPKNRMEDCSKIVKKIMLEKKMPESGEKKRNSGELEDSIETFNTEEMMDLLMNDSQLKHSDTTRVSCDLDKSSKRNSSEFDDSIGSFFSDQMVLKLSKSNEFLNAKPNLFSDNLVPEDLTNVIDRTPSAEDLPMECEVEPTIAPTSPRSTSPELPQESSRTPNAPVSIITSITSIMSLDTGYQGDGELSRPESRNTENESRVKLPIAENGILVKTINFDDGKTMTDSDFFTESDADVHDDLSAAAAEIGSGKGDRKAQVIDGTLYGGAFIQTHATVREASAKAPEHRAVLGRSSTNEDMESSGIYSDLEKKPEEVQPPVSYLGLITEQMKTIQNLALLVAERKNQSEGIVKSSSAESSSTVQEVTPSVRTSPSDLTRGTSERANPKNKTPNRGGTTKNPAGETESRGRTLKKGKWDAVMDKIAQGKEENKYTPSKFRDIKSKVFQNIGPLFNGRKSEPEVRTSPNAQTKARSRRSTRIRSSESSLVSPKSKLSRTSASPNSSQRSSLSDVSLSGNPHHKSATRSSKKRDSNSPPSADSTISTTTPLRKLNNNDESVSTANGTTPRGNPDLQNGNAVHSPSTTMKTPTMRKTPIPRRAEVGQALHRTASVPLKDSNHNGIVSKSGSSVIINNNNSTQNNNKVKSSQSFQSKTLKMGAKGGNSVQVKNGCLLSVARETNKALLKQLKHNSRAFESLAILFAYCTDDLDAFATPYLKQKLEVERRKFIQAQSDLEELQSRLIRVREELNDKELVISELKTEKVNLNEERENFRRLVSQLEAEVKAATEEKMEAESELLRECERLKRELSDRTESFETEKNSLVYCLGESKKENKILRTVNVEMKEEYNKCLTENQRLVELANRKQNEVAEKENVDVEEGTKKRRGDSKEKSPVSPVQKKSHRGEASNPSCLESEVESLRQVLALKTDEVTELRRQELFLRENADRVPKLLSTITMLEGKVEDLQTQLSSQTETVRDLFKSNDHLEEELKSANIQKTRLAQQNEELQYKLKLYAEAMKQLANQKSLCEKSVKTELSPIKSNSKRAEGLLDDSMKSQMKAVVEKSDSVSYMLEMTEDSSEIVTNIIRRAESLRSNVREGTLPKKKRSKATSVSSTDAETFKRNSLRDDEFKPNVMSTPSFSPNEYEYDTQGSNKSLSPAPSPLKYPVRLSQDDFSTDSIELPNGNDCEVIEITKNFDKTDKMVTSTSSSSSNGSHFDIESDVFSNLENDQNVHELDEDTESSEFQDNGSTIRTFRRETENIQPVLPVYADLDGGNFVGEEEDKQFLTKNTIKIPKISGGEAMIGLSSDDEDIEKIKMCNE